MVTTVRLYYNAVIAVALMAVVAIICGFVAAVIAGGSPPNFPVAPMGWRPYYGAMEKKGTAGGTGLGQPLRSAPFEDDAPPNPDLYRGSE